MDLNPYPIERDVTLTAQQVDERKAWLVTELGELERVESEKKAANTDFNGSIKLHKRRIRELYGAIVSGVETQTVQVFDRTDERRGCVEVVRVDTNEVLDTRPLTNEERQGDLFGEDGEALDVEVDEDDDEQREDEALSATA